ncbi:MAG: alpha/beta hydrolase [Phycisphaerae bacterium]
MVSQWKLLLVLLGVAAIGATAAAQTVDLRFVVVTPDGGDVGAIYMASSLDGWAEGGRRLERVADGVFVASVPATVGQSFEYKLTRTGKWASVEKSAGGGEVPNRQLTVESAAATTVVHVVSRWADQEKPARAVRLPETQPVAVTPVAQPASTRTGDIRVHNEFESPQLGNKRTVQVYLPPGYEQDSQQRYPVLYMQDGNNVFDVATAFSGVEWAADETAERLIAEKKIRKLIIVAIDNTPDRVNDYTPVSEPTRGGGKADAYLKFVTDTVKPFIDKTYRTLPDVANTSIGGSSLGGVISLYAVFSRPDVFGSAAVVSPAVWWADRHLLKYVKDAPANLKPKLWIDIGTNEGTKTGNLAPFTRAVQDCRDLVEILKQRGYVEGDRLRYEEIEGGNHNERDWAARMDRILLFMFPTGGATTQSSGR